MSQNEKCDRLAELRVVSALYRKPEWAEQICSALTPGDFSDAAYCALFREAQTMFLAGEEIDQLVAAERAEERDRDAFGDFVVDGGENEFAQTVASAVCQLMNDNIPSLAHLQYSVERVKTLSAKRAYDLEVRGTLGMLFDPDMTLADIATTVTVQSRLTEKGKSEATVSLNDSIDVLSLQYAQAADGEMTRRFWTGIEALDRSLRIRRSGLVLIAAKPKTGKSWLVLKTALNTVRRGGRVLLATSEMPHEEFTERILTSQTAVRSGVLENPRGEDDLTHIQDHLQSLRTDLPLLYVVQDQAERLLCELDRQCRQAPTELIVVDYLQNYELPLSYGDSEHARIAKFARKLHSVSRTHRVPILVVSSLRSTEVPGQEEKPPQIGDIFGSRQVAHIADAVLLMHRTSADPEVVEFRIPAARSDEDHRRWWMRRNLAKGEFVECGKPGASEPRAMPRPKLAAPQAYQEPA